MEYIDGSNLDDHFAEKKTFTEKEAAKFITKILRALKHIHAADVVHRDIKPQNIMIDSNGNPKLIDFGLSKETQGK